MATAAERKAAERQRHRDAGRVPVTVHVLPQQVSAVRALEAELRKADQPVKSARAPGTLHGP